MTNKLQMLTVKLPWAWLITHAPSDSFKDIENRNWPTLFLGTIGIHASKETAHGGVDLLEYQAAKDLITERKIDVEMPSFEAMRKYAGCVMGLIDIRDCVTQSNSKWFIGPYGFVLSAPRPLSEPFKCRGSQRFWQASPETIAEIKRQLKL